MSRLGFLPVIAGLLMFVGSATAADPIDFAHDVLPILKAHCAKCHTNGTYKGSFSLDTRTSLLEAKVVEPGKPDDSDLIQRVTSSDPDVQMPPEGPRLNEKE